MLKVPSAFLGLGFSNVSLSCLWLDRVGLGALLTRQQTNSHAFKFHNDCIACAREKDTLR